MHMGTLLICVSVHHVGIWSPPRPEEGIESPESGVPDGYELSYCWWVRKPSPPEEQSEPSLQYAFYNQKFKKEPKKPTNFVGRASDLYLGLGKSWMR